MMQRFIYQIYRFKGHYPYRSYQGSIKNLLITVPNDKGHFSISAGVCLGAGGTIKLSKIGF